MFPGIKKLCITASVGLRFQLTRKLRATCFILLCIFLSYFLIFTDIPGRTMDGVQEPVEVVFGIVSSKKYINDRILALFETSILDMQNIKSKVIFSFDNMTKSDIDFIHNRFPLSNNNNIHIMKTNCDSGYDQLPCRTLELFDQMKVSAPDAQWFMKMDDDTMIFPENLVHFLSGYDSDDNFGIGGPCFYYCEEPTECFHRRSPLVPWSSRNSIERTVLGGPGYVLSKSVVNWVTTNGHIILEYGPKASNNAEDLMLFRSLNERMDGFKLVQSEAFHFDRPEVSTRYGSIPYKTLTTTFPVSFHMMHNIYNSTQVYKFLKRYISMKPDVSKATEKEHACGNHLRDLRNDYLEFYERLLTGVEEVFFISNPRDEETFLNQLAHFELLKELGVQPVYIDIMGEKYRSKISAGKKQAAIFHECKGCFGGFKDRMGGITEAALRYIFVGNKLFETYREAEFYKTMFKTTKSAISIVAESVPASLDTLKQFSSIQNVHVYYGVDDVRLTLRLDQLKLDIEDLPKYDILIENGMNSKKPKKISVDQHSSQKTWLKRKSLRKENLDEVTEISDDWVFDVNEMSIQEYPYEELRILIADYAMFLSRGRFIVTQKENTHMLATLVGIHHIYIIAEPQEDQAILRDKSIPDACRVNSIHTDVESATEETLGILFPNKSSQNNWIQQWSQE